MYAFYKHFIPAMTLAFICTTTGCTLNGDLLLDLESPDTLADDTSSPFSSDDIDTETTENQDTSHPSDTDPPVCEDVAGVDFGDCDILLGAGIIHGSCMLGIYGCSDQGYSLFPNKEACDAACLTEEDLCVATGGAWDKGSRGGHYLCGQPPVCSTPECNDPNIFGCNCGPNTKWDDTLGCVHEESCVAPTCDDLVAVDFQYGLCTGAVGWAVRDGSCQLIKGCSDLSIGVFPTRDDCNAACLTPQRLCMESQGAWVGTDSFTPEPSNFYYHCGDQVSDSAPPLPPCNCGPSANYTNGVGCVADGNCPIPQSTCPDYDFVDYTATPAGECSVQPHPVGRGIYDGTCGTIIGCPDDFEGPDAFVPEGAIFASSAECEEACSPRCYGDTDCPDPNPNDEMGRYCHFDFDSNCGAFTNGGICKDFGGFCGGGFDPVCGCDGVYVSNTACISVRGRPMRYEGECFEFPSLP